MKKIFVLVPVIICLTACMSNITIFLDNGFFFAWSDEKDKAWIECSHELQDELESENITTLMHNCMNRKGF